VRKNTQSPCRTKTPHLALLAASATATIKQVVVRESFNEEDLIRYIDPADIEQWHTLETQRNAILENCRSRRAAERARLERERIERIHQQQLDWLERIAREREAREARERAERERREQEERRQLELARQVNDGIPFLDFYKTVRRNAPARVPEAIASLEREIAKLSHVSVEQMTRAQLVNYNKLRKWHFVMTRNPVHNQELDKIWAMIWDAQVRIQEQVDKPPAVFDRTIRPSVLSANQLPSDQHPYVEIVFDCKTTFTFTIKHMYAMLQTCQVVVANVEMQTAGLYPIAMNIVTCENAPVGLATDKYIAVSYCSPNPDRLAVIQLYEFTVVEPLFDGHAYDIAMKSLGRHNVEPCIDVTCVRRFQKLAVDYDASAHWHCMYKYEYLFC